MHGNSILYKVHLELFYTRAFKLFKNFHAVHVCSDDLFLNSPEVIQSHRFDSKADVYSFGIVLWELMTGEVPYSDCGDINAFSVMFKVANEVS